MSINSKNACPVDQSIPQWKRELLLRRRALGRTIQVGNSTVKLTCPAVVSVVRQPESINTGVSGNVTTFKPFQLPCQDGELSSALCSQNYENLHTEDLHPGTQSPSTPLESVNMRLLDLSSDVNNLEINGSDVINKQSDCESSTLCVRYNLIMGEDKMINQNKKCVSATSKLDCNGCVVIRQQNLKEGVGSDQIKKWEINGISAKEDDGSSDSSEELQYGPGIVNKLKSKYLSMTLREQKRSSRPSINSLRRATSLENILEASDSLNSNIRPMSSIATGTKTDRKVINPTGNNTEHTVDLNSQQSLKYLENQSLETMKRARSMETLLKAEAKVLIKHAVTNRSKNVKNLGVKKDLYTNCNEPIASIVNENIVIVENLECDSNTTSLNDKLTCREDSQSLSKQSPSVHQNKKTGNIHAELPPPDLVKQTLKIFETSPQKKIKPNIQSNPSKLVANKELSSPFNQKSTSLNSKIIGKGSRTKPILSPKPILTPEKLKQNRPKIVSPKKMNRPSANLKTNSVNNHPSSTNSNNMPENLLLQNISQKNSEEESASAQSPKIVDPGSLASNFEQVALSPTVHGMGTAQPVIFGLKQIDENVLNADDQTDGNESEYSKAVPESVLENIRRGGGSVVHYSFHNESLKNSSVPKSYLPTQRSAPQALNTSLLNQNFEKPPQVLANITPLRPSSGITKQVGIIRPLVTSKTQSSLLSPSTLTEQEIEKNLINCVKSIEQPISKVVVSIKALPEHVVVGSVSSDKVSNKNISLPRVCSNSNSKTQTLWDEKLWLQNQNTIVFNFSDRKEVPDYIENDGLILKTKRDRPRPGEGGVVILGGTGDESYTDPEDLLVSEPPSPCDVTFEGDNVLINGKSNLKKSPRQIKLRIKFNDEATTMFEYPSEASLTMEEVSNDDSPSGSQSSTITPSLGPSLPQALGGGGSLGAYTPRKTGAEDWQLGMSPVLPPTVPLSPPPQTDQDHLKPAPPEATTAWSEDTASDLLF